MSLDDEDSGDGLKLLSGTHGMEVPSACTIVIIAGNNLQTKIDFRNHFGPNSGLTLWLIKQGLVDSIP